MTERCAVEAAAVPSGAPEAWFRPAIELATPELYDRIAFRVLELPVYATERDLARRRDLAERAARNKLPVPPGPARILPRPATGESEVREAAQALRDGETRLVHEFFWFWPLDENAPDDPALAALGTGDEAAALAEWEHNLRGPARGAARHNLAVYHHLKALDGEPAVAGSGTAPAGSPAPGAAAGPQEHGQAAAEHWVAAIGEGGVWTRLSSRIRGLDDAALTTGASRRLRQTLPVVLALIAARLALRAREAGRTADAERHVAWLRQPALPQDAVNEALRVAAEPLRALIRSLCEAAERQAEADPAKADEALTRFLGQAGPPLAAVDFLMPEGHPARQAEHDQVASQALSCWISFGNATQNWRKALAMMDRFAPFAASAAMLERIAHNRQIAADNVALASCWYCNRNDAVENLAVAVEMHGNVVRGGGRVTWNQRTIKVPRCAACRRGQARQEGAKILVYALLALPMGVIFAATQAPVGAWVVGLVALLGVTALIVTILKQSTDLFGDRTIKPRKRNDYPPIKEQLSSGWKFGAKPQGVN